MNPVARFKRVSEQQLKKDWCLDAPVPSDIPIPKRATTGSAGYDFFAPADLTIQPGQTLRVPTGIRCEIDDGWVLLIFPRSSLGFKYRLRLSNTVGVIDSDYARADNEGHIFIKLSNEGDQPVHIEQNSAFAQGLLLPFGLAEEEQVTKKRHGGEGSTTKSLPL